ncbi:heparinase II/III family protein [Paenibacillus sp. CAU 1782]
MMQGIRGGEQTNTQMKEQIRQLLEIDHVAGTLSMLCDDVDSAALGRRLASDPGLKGLLEEIGAEAQELLSEPEPELTEELYTVYRTTGERLSYERPYFRKRKRLNAFAFMTLMEPENDTYRNALLGIVESICNERTWCLPAHYSEEMGPLGSIDLFAAETGFALAELSVLLADRLPLELLERIGDEAEKRLFQPFLNAVSYSWEGLRNNWSAVCGGSIGAAALYLIKDKDRLSAVLERSIKATDCFLEGYGADGACVEGYLYWQYGFGYYVYFASLLKRATGGRLDGFADPKVKQIALFQQRSFSSRGTVINFSDSIPRSGVFMGLTWRLRDEYAEIALPNPELRFAYGEDHCGRWAPALRNLIWASGREGVAIAGEANGEAEAVAEASGISLSKEAALEDWPAEAVYMTDAEWLVSRHAGDNGSVYCFAAKGGHNDEPHNHNDCGTFLLHADGEAYLADLGSGMYTEAYFGPERYDFWCNGSQGHSLPIVHSCTQSPGVVHSAKVISAEIGDAGDSFDLELAAAYPEEAGLESLTRQFRWFKNGSPRLELKDSFVMKDSDGLTERFITLLEPKLEQRGIVSLEGSRQLAIHYDGEAWSPQVTKRSDIDHFGRERSWYSLDFNWNGKVMEGSDVEIVARFEFAFD